MCLQTICYLQRPCKEKWSLYKQNVKFLISTYAYNSVLKVNNPLKYLSKSLPTAYYGEVFHGPLSMGKETYNEWNTFELIRVPEYIFFFSLIHILFYRVFFIFCCPLWYSFPHSESDFFLKRRFLISLFLYSIKKISPDSGMHSWLLSAPYKKIWLT